ncbi:MAG: type II methionyl aminopeptidase [Candidatus Thorarchaeota archaeon]|nr:type II methionyl aminopeptidase [Candidatus Thorarchaeota archaeon]
MRVRPHPDLVKAGRIAARALADVVKTVRPGVQVSKVCKLAEAKILDYGATGLAFPCNLSIDEVAAHYTSPRNDTSVIPDKGLVKIDIGASVRGYLSDTATTVDIDGSYEEFVAASSSALEEAIEAMRPGARLGDIGAVIERGIKRNGFRPVYELSGHQMKRGVLHAGKSVPNIATSSGQQVLRGETYAIEPFATDGDGTVRMTAEAYIFSNMETDWRRLRAEARSVYTVARRRFGSLPWASRWLAVDGVDVDAAIRELVNAGALREYPVLVEGKLGMVAQAEHSVFVGADGAMVLTSTSTSSTE